MKPINENGYCPYCNADLDGEDIVEFFMKKDSVGKEEAYKWAKDYGYRPGHTKWDRRICITPPERDVVTHYKCPDCGEVWKRRV